MSRASLRALAMFFVSLCTTAGGTLPRAALTLAVGTAITFDLAGGPSIAVARDKNADKKGKTGKTDKTDSEKPATKQGQKPFDEVVKDTEKSEGLFTVYRSKDHFYFEVPEAAFGTDYCLTAQTVGAIGDWSARGSGVGVDLVRFERQGDNVALVKKNVNFRADDGTTIRRAVDKTFPDSPILVKSIAATKPENGAPLADLADLFSASTYEILSRRYGYKADGNPPVILSVHDNPKNLTVRVAFHFARASEERAENGSGGVARLADPRHLEITLQFDLFPLPANGFRARRNDDRLGFFDIGYKDYTGIDDRETAFRYHAARWGVEKSDPKAAVSAAKQPITFYIDKATPREVRPLIREGALWWNEAFEAAGISGAVDVKDEPDSANWDPTDIRYSMIYWNLTDDLNFSGMAGPSLINPLNGEVLKANVYLNAEFLSYARHRYLVYSWWRAPGGGEREGGDWERGGSASLDDASSWRSEVADRASSRRTRTRLCDYQGSFSSQLAFARILLESRGILVPGGPEEDRYAREAFLELVAHEVGHALGFGHNFKASRVSSYADIAKGVTGRQFSASVMDYNPINLPPKGHSAGDYFLKRLGDYDKLIVEYLYRQFDGKSPAEEDQALAAIAARAESAPGLAYDDGTLSEIDPTSNTDDLGDDAIRFSDDRLAMVEEVMPKLPAIVLGEGHDYNLLRQALDAAIFSVSMDYFDIASRHVGGQEVLRVHHAAGVPVASGASLSRAPIRPISAATQRAALELIDRRLFADSAYSVGPDLLCLLKPDLERDWNYPYRYGSNYAYESRVAYLYGTTLGTLLDPSRLGRVKDNEARFAAGEPVFTMPELFERLTTGVMRGLDQGNVSATRGRSALVASKRRTLQRIYVGLLSDLALSPAKDTPADATVLAAAELRKVRERARRASADPKLAPSLDAYGRAHLADLDTRIGRVLDAKIGIPVRTR